MLTDKNGRVVTVGDRVRTPAGDVVEIKGSLPRRREFKMADCEVVSRDTPLDEGEPGTGEQLFA